MLQAFFPCGKAARPKSKIRKMCARILPGGEKITAEYKKIVRKEIQNERIFLREWKKNQT